MRKKDILKYMHNPPHGNNEMRHQLEKCNNDQDIKGK
jgi:hypothetical protein